MYCINCGACLHDRQEACPLCGTAVCHPDFPKRDGPPLYPKHKSPRIRSGRSSLCGAVTLLFLVPLLVCLIADLQGTRGLDWFGYAVTGVMVAYAMMALPLWFVRPNPVIFVPCGFLATALCLGHIAAKTDGGWYFSFALPLTGALCLVVTAAVTLLRYVPRGKWFIWGGTVMALGGCTLLVEWLLAVTFGIPGTGWSFYPLVSLGILGGLLIWLGASPSARAVLYRKLFF